MNTNIKAYNLFWNLYKKNNYFKQIIDESIANRKIRFFNDEEWDKIKNQNFLIPNSIINSFYDFFVYGLNIGNCVTTSLQLSFSYDDIDIVAGTLSLLKGTTNAEVCGGHRWLETSTTIIDTTLMLIIDKSLKDILGYHEEERLTYQQLLSSNLYKTRKEFINDKNLKK